MLLKSVVFIKVVLLVVLCFLQVVIGILDYLMDVLSKMSYIRHPTLGTHNSINRQPNLFPINHLKPRATNALCHC